MRVQQSRNRHYSINSSISSNNTPIVSSKSIVVGDTHYLTSEDYNKFFRLIHDKTVIDEAPTSANMTGTSLFNSFNYNVSFQKRVVDSGANQHMIANESLLHDIIDVSKLIL